MLTLRNISKSYGPYTVLDQISLTLNKGEKAGLVGANGAGKSTLMRIMAGIEIPDTGDIVPVYGLKTAYLPQSLAVSEYLTVNDLLDKAAADIREIENRINRIEESMDRSGETPLYNPADKQDELSTAYHGNEGYKIDYRIDSVMEGLGIACLDRLRPVHTLSGGEKTRLGLAMLLLKDADLLLLDEPTNNLDDTSLRWLENFLSAFKGAVITASHDREFLNNTVNTVYEIDEHAHRLKKYSGDYDVYKTAKGEERSAWEEAYRKQQEIIEEISRKIKIAGSSSNHAGQGRKTRDNDKFVPHFKGQRKQSSISRTIRKTEEQLERIRENPVPRPPRFLRFKADFAPRTIRSAEVIRAENIGRSYGTGVVFQGINLVIEADARIVITGPNGSGKTTLLEILAGISPPDTGRTDRAPHTRIGYLPQEPEMLNTGKTLLDFYRQGLTGSENDFIFVLVTCGLFRYEEIYKKTGELSLGQLQKLQIARLIGIEPNTLILDEPTNHLSLDTLESFESAIEAFRGPVIAVSHDRRFIRKFGKVIWEIRKGMLTQRVL
ncbi:MAG: ABC-F family ATP-binding cassette domain-containing protein [Dehalococcoidales bacterium]|nr:ABC-F family ATP-binding cassette domain-containing protein [Dehalococcoidales bacterium]